MSSFDPGDIVRFRDRGQDAEGTVLEVRAEEGGDVLVIAERQGNGTTLRFQRYASFCELIAQPIAGRP